MNPIETFLQEQTWTFAKSMPKIPHEYIVRIKVGNDELFSAAVKYIRENGVTEYFYKTPYIYLYLNGYKYWTMGLSPQETTIINRAKA